MGNEPELKIEKTSPDVRNYLKQNSEPVEGEFETGLQKLQVEELNGRPEQKL